MRHFVYTLFVSLVAFTGTLCAQGTFSVHAGPAFPIGDFGDDDYNNDPAGHASLGFGIGAKYAHPVTDFGLGVFGSVDLILNGIKKSTRDDWEEEYPGSDFTFEKYLSIPVCAGAQYQYDLNENLGFYGQFGLMVHFLKMTKWEWREPGDDDYIENYDLSTKLGVVFGAGVVLNNMFEFGFSVMASGERDIDGEYDYGTDHDTFDFQRKVGLFNLTAGYRF